MKRVSLSVALFVMLFLGGTAYGTTIYVNSFAGNDTFGNGSALNPYQTISKAISMAVNGDVIDLTGTFTADGTIMRGIAVSKNVTIQGHGAGQTIVQAAATRGTADRTVFTIQYATVTLRQMTIRYGRRTASTHPTYGAGAGIYISPWSSLTVDQCVIEENDLINYTGTTLGGAGGVLVDENSQLQMTNSSVRNNTSTADVYAIGGIGVHESQIILRNCTIASNTGTDPSPGADKDISNSVGGIAIRDAVSAEITNCTIAYNHSNDDAGGLAIAVSNAMTTTDVTNCTIAYNSASDKGGGVLICAYNSTTALRIKNTIVAENSSVNETQNQDLTRWMNSGSLYNNGYNIVEFTDYQFNATGDMSGNQALLNLSATLNPNNNPNGNCTLKTTFGSVAIDAGDTGANGSVPIPAVDQRTAPRNGNTDIGAYEYYSDSGVLPVELTMFTARLYENTVRLEWKTATELQNYGFEVLRNTDGVWNAIGFVPGAGTSNAPREYSYIDGVEPQWTTASYRLRQIDRDGSETLTDIVEVVVTASRYALAQNWPNPFNPSTNITFSLAERQPVSLAVYDISGRLITVLADGEYPAGTHTVIFNAPDIPSGTYLYSLRAGEHVFTRSLLLAR